MMELGEYKSLFLGGGGGGAGGVAGSGADPERSGSHVLARDGLHWLRDPGCK